MTQYDESILQQYADALYDQARWIVIQTALQYAGIAFIIAVIVIGVVSALGPQIGVRGDQSSGETVLTVIVTAIGLGIGISHGRRKAFRLKLQAQQILCQRQIELNTRAGTAHTSA